MEAEQSVLNESPNFLTVSPNPSNGNTPVRVIVELPEGSDGGTLNVFDPVGKQIVVQEFNGALQLLDIQTEALASGLYIVTVAADGIALQQTKFEILR